MTDPLLLQMAGIAKRFGATSALRGVSLAVRAGEVMALVGENGAGKSTLVKILSGAIQPDAGSMQLGGSVYEPAGPIDARRHGVAMIYQELTLAPDLSVEDNIMLGQECSRWGLVDRAAQRPRVRQALDLLGHPELRPETPVQSLSVAARQLVEIARALVQQARLIVFDEPTSSLGRHDTEHLFRVIRLLRDQGIGIVYISHFLEEIRDVCDSYTVLRDGESVGTGALVGVSEEQIVTLMVGRSVDELFPVVPHQIGEPALTIERVCGHKLPQDVTLTVRRGEILGIAGLVGAGRTELLRIAFGLDPAASGTLHTGGKASRGTPKSRIAAGLGMVSEDRKAEGLAQGRSIADNLTYSRLEPYSSWGFINLRSRRRAVDRWIERLAIKARSPEQEIATLSGGNQQKVAIARVLHQQAEVLLLDEPTRGIDVATKAAIYRLIGELAAAGKAIIVVSSYLPELLAICDTIGVMVRGRLSDVRPAGQWSEETIMACAVGLEDSRADSASGDPTEKSKRGGHMNELAPFIDEQGPGTSRRLIAWSERVGLMVAAYLVMAGLIWACDGGAALLGMPVLKFSGLVLDIVLLTWLGVWLARRGNPIGGTIGPLVALLLIVLLFSVVDWLMHGQRATFWSVANLRMIAVQTSTVAVAALGMTMIIIAGGIDLSAGTTLALSATVLAFGLDSGWGIVASIAACMATGFAAGLVNGSLISLLGVVPFIITLGTMSVYLGLGKLVAKETTVRPPPSVVPAWLPKLVTPYPRPAWLVEPLVPNFGWGVWLAGGLAILLAALLHRTVFGRHAFAIGSSEPTARLCGINVTRTKILVYAFAGLFVGIAGLYQFARLTEGSPTAGLGAELKIIAAVVIGGGSLTGGRGSVVGTLTGAAIMLVIASGCTALGLKNPMQDIIIGVIIVAAVTLDQVRQRRLLAS